MAGDGTTVTVRVGFDDRGFQEGVSRMSRNLKLIQSEFAVASSKLGDYGKSTEGMKLKAETLSKQIAVQREKVETLNKAYQEAVEKKGADSKAAENLKIKLNNATAELNNMERDLKKLNKEIEIQSSNWTKMGKACEETGKKMQDAGKGFQDVGKKLSLGITAPLVGIGTASAKLAMDFEKDMSAVRALVNPSDDDFKKLTATAREMGKATSKSASEAAQAMQYMGLAGWETEQITASILPVLKLAEAGNLDLARASNLVTNSLAAQGKKTDELDDYLNVLAQSSRSCNLDISDLAESYITAGGILNTLNVPLTESASLLGLLANRGQKGSEAGRSLSAVLINMTKKGGESATAMKKLGLSAFDAKGNFKGVEVTLRELKEKTAGLTEEQRNMYYSMIGGKSHISTLTNLLEGLDEEYVELRETIEDFDGVLFDMAETMQNNLRGELTKLKSALEEAGISIGNVFLEKLTDLAKYLQTLVERFNNLDESQKKTIVVIGAIAAAIGPVLVIFGKFLTSIGSIVSVFGKMSTAIGASGGVFGACGKALAALTNPVGLVVAAILGLIAIFVALYKNNEDFRNNVKEVWSNIKNTISTFIDAIKELFSAFVAIAKYIWDKYGDDMIRIFKTAFNIISGVVDTVMKLIRDIIKTITALIKGDWQGVWEGLKSFTSNLWNGIKDYIGNVLSLIFNVVKVQLQLIRDFFSNIWNGIKDLTSAAWNKVKSLIEEPINAAKNAVKNALDAIFGFFKNLKLPEIKIPKIKLPHFKMEGEFSIMPPKIPKFSVEWYSKGGIFNAPRVIGVGEAGTEAVLPIDKLPGLLSKMNNTNNGQVVINNAELFKGANLTLKSRDDLVQLADLVSEKIGSKFTAANRSRGAVIVSG